MAEGEESSQERSLPPTQKKLLDARKKGQIARSRELNTSVMLLSSSAIFFVFGESTSAHLVTLFESSLQIDRFDVFDPTAPLEKIVSVVLSVLVVLSPVFLLLVCACIIGPVLVGGMTFSRESFQPKLSRMDFLKGIKRMFGLHGLVELLKSLCKFILLALVAFWLFYLLRESYLALGTLPLGQAVKSALMMITLVFATLSATTLFVAMLDVPYQKWDHIRKLRMTRQEMKEESKESEGNPEVRAKIRRLQQEAASRKMLSDVKDSDVIVINPTHYSIALKYNQSGSGAPVVVARGVDHMALHIREIARQHDVPLFRGVALARALYFNVKLQEEIPLELFNAVAQVLAYVYQLQEFKAGNASEPVKPDNLPVPGAGRLL